MSQQILVISSLNSIAPANYLIDAFRNLAVEVIAISDVKNKRANHVANGAFDVQNYVAINDLQPDLLLFVEGGEMAQGEYLGCLTVDVLICADAIDGLWTDLV